MRAVYTTKRRHPNKTLRKGEAPAEPRGALDGAVFCRPSKRSRKPEALRPMA